MTFCLTRHFVVLDVWSLWMFYPKDVMSLAVMSPDNLSPDVLSLRTMSLDVLSGHRVQLYLVTLPIFYCRSLGGVMLKTGLPPSLGSWLKTLTADWVRSLTQPSPRPTKVVETVKGTVARDFRPLIFSSSTPSGPLIHTLKYFRIRLRIRQDIRIQSLTDRYII
jgi:hypothetical protein